MKNAIRHTEVDAMLKEVSRAARIRGFLEGFAFVVLFFFFVAFFTFPEWRALICL